MSNVNDYAFANKLQSFKEKILDVQKVKTEKAEAIMHDNNHPWKDEEQRKAGQAQYDSYKAWLVYYQTFYDEGVKLTTQHENLVNKVSKWYDKWFNDISNDGRQEIEMMSMQADFLSDIFTEMYNELKPLNLDGVKPPKALNLK